MIKVALISWTKDPTDTMMFSFDNMHNDIPDDLTKYVFKQVARFGEDKWDDVKTSFLKMLAINPHCSVLEFVNTVWLIKGVSRAFQQQLTRTRTAAYSIQSMRIVDVGSFCDDKTFRTPPRLTAESKLADEYNTAMKDAQSHYRELIKLGAKVEDARGVLPLNITSPITMSINLRALTHMLEVRMCNLAQDEFREVCTQMLEQISTKLGKDYLCLFRKPCDAAGHCTMPVNCGKTQHKLEKEYVDLNVSNWLKG